jgi:hypothetical protein
MVGFGWDKLSSELRREFGWELKVDDDTNNLGSELREKFGWGLGVGDDCNYCC